MKTLKTSISFNEKSTLEKFTLLIDELVILRTKNTQTPDLNLQAKKIVSVLNSLRTLKLKVYHGRLEETKGFIFKNSEMFKISSFELMEHNFRENTHSNILKYIFDYGFTNNEGVEALFLLLNELKNNKIKDLKSKLLLRKYKIEREFNTGKGRIDLLIKDEFNKIIIVIENKVYADIAEKDFDEEKNITSTQLDLYKDCFINNAKYSSWDKLFILLSYRDIDNFNDTYFELVNYDTLFRILSEVSFQDSIVKDYLILLNSLTNNIYNKNWLIEQSKSIMSNTENINLNILEAINNF